MDADQPLLTITTRDEADAALAHLGRVEREMSAADLAHKDQVNRLTAEHARAVAPHVAMQATLRNALQAYATRNRRKLLDGANTGVVTLPSGRIGWKINPAKLVLPDDKAALKKLVAWLFAKHPDTIRTVHEIDKAVLKAKPEIVAKLKGAEIVEEEVFVCTPLAGEVR